LLLPSNSLYLQYFLLIAEFQPIPGHLRLTTKQDELGTKSSRLLERSSITQATNGRTCEKRGTHLDIDDTCPIQGFSFEVYKGRLEAIRDMDDSSINFRLYEEMSAGASVQIRLHIQTQYWPAQSILAPSSSHGRRAIDIRGNRGKHIIR
jgi:hypothetical protein